jgi:outer membrane protein TolC
MFRLEIKYLLTLCMLFAAVLSYGQGRTLNEYIELAKQNSASIRSLQNQILSNQIDSQILKATTRTQLNFVSNEMYAPVIKGWGYDEIITNIAQVSAMIQATKTFLSKENLGAQYRRIALQSQSLRDTIFLSTKDLVKTITEQYITAYGDQLTMDNSQELYSLLQKESEVLKKLAQSNVIKQTDFLVFDITVKQQELTYLQAQIQYNADYLTLNYLAGIVDTTITRVVEPRLEDSIVHDFYSTAFYQRYVTDSLRIENERRLINYDYRPKVSAFTDGGFNTSLQNTPYKNVGFSFGVNIKKLIYDGHQKRLKYQKLDIEESTRLTNRTFFINQYRQQVSQLLIQLNAADKLFEQINQQLNYTKTLIIAYDKLLETSDVKITDLVIAITGYLNAQNAYRQNLITRFKIVNQLNYWNR